MKWLKLLFCLFGFHKFEWSAFDTSEDTRKQYETYECQYCEKEKKEVLK
jgi:hypothetical protein